MGDETDSTGKLWGRWRIANTVLGWGLFAISILGGISLLAVLSLSSPSARLTGVKDILSLLLPVVSVWVGTVLAYYFGRENFESAAKNTADLVKQLTSEEKASHYQCRRREAPSCLALGSNKSP